MIFIQALMNVDRMLKLKLNLLIGPNINYKNTFYGYKNKRFHFV